MARIGGYGEYGNKDRLKSIIGVLLVEGLLGYVLLLGLRVPYQHRAAPELRLFTLSPPPEPAAPRPRQNVSAGGGSGAPAKLPPKIVLAPPVPSIVPVIALSVPPAAISGGGGGGGTGGEGGLGTGDGTGSGVGDGPGGVAVSAELLKGRLRNSDLPKAVREIDHLAVGVRYMVGSDGRVGSCEVTASSGHAELDAITCPLIVKRFRFAPAEDEQGRPVAEEQVETEHWVRGG